MGKIRRIFQDPKNNLEIVFQFFNDEEHTNTLEENELQNSLESLANSIRNLKHTDKKVKEQYITELVGIAQVGFIGENPSIESALKGVENLKENILESQGHKIKNAYHISLGIHSICFLAFVWLIYLSLLKVFAINVEIAVFIVITGALIGQWLSFGARKWTFNFEDMVNIEQDKMSKSVRIVFIILSSFMLYIILTSNLIEFKFGGFTSESLTTWNSQLLLGFIAGLLDSKLGLKLYEKATEITK